MKKIIVIIGSIIGLLGIFAGLIDQTLGWWELTSVYDVLLITITLKTFLSPFGNITHDFNETVTALEGNAMILIAILVIIGNISVLIGGSVDKKLVSIIGISVVLLCLIYFLYALGNFEQISYYIVDGTKSVLFGKETYTLGFTFNNSWRLGNGFFFISAGSIVSVVGLALKD